MLELNFTNFPKLLTARLRLRPIMFEDAHAFFAMRSNKEFMKFLDRPKPKNIAEIELMIQSIQKNVEDNESITWVICRKENEAFMGTISFWRIIKEHYRAEIGYGIHPGFQQKGYMSEAIQAVIDYAFQKMNLHSIEANVNPNNIASRKLLEKNGFVKEAHFKENYYYNGQFLDSVIYSLVASATRSGN